MKKVIISAALLVSGLFLSNANAQVGLRAGVNLATLSASATEENYNDYERNSVLGYQLALAFPIKIAEKAAIQPELMYVQKGGKATYGFNNSNKVVVSQKLDYVELPVSLKLSLGNTSGSGLGAYVLAGPYVGLALGGTTKRDFTVAGATTTTESKVNFNNDDAAERQKRMDFGGQLGVGVSIGSLFFDLRYSLGLNNLLDNDANNNNDSKPYLRTRGLGLSLGYMF